jgi:hypothetical protein
MCPEQPDRPAGPDPVVDEPGRSPTPAAHAVASFLEVRGTAITREARERARDRARAIRRREVEQAAIATWLRDRQS